MHHRGTESQRKHIPGILHYAGSDNGCRMPGVVNTFFVTFVRFVVNLSLFLSVFSVSLW